MKAFCTRAAGWLSRQPPQVVFFIGLAWVLLLGAVDNLCADRISFSLYYLAAIALVAWRAGLQPALLLTFLAVLAGGLHEWMSTHGTAGHSVLLWNTVGRFLEFSGVAWLVAKMIRSIRSLNGLVEERTAVWKAEAAERHRISERLAETLERCEQLTNRITERKVEETELRSREERLRLGLESARMVTWDYDIASGSLHYSDNLADFVGGDTIQPYCSLEEVLQRIHPDHRENVRRGLKAAEAPGAIFEEEYLAKMVDGTYRWILAKGRAVRDETGAAVRISGLSLDNTLRKQAETQLRRSEERYRTLAEAFPDAVFNIDRELRLKYLNSAAAALWRRTPQELVGRRQPDLFPSATARHHTEMLTRIFETGQEARRDESVPFPGGERWLDTRLVPLRDEQGAVISVLGVARDITERRRNEQQIRFLADALQSTQELISVTDHENRFTFVNRAFLEAYGYTEEEILGQLPEILVSKNNPPGLTREIFQQTLAGGWTGEILDRTKDGTEFPVALSTSLIRDSEGNVIGLIGVARDISEQKRAEKQRTAFSQLGHRLSVAVEPDQVAQVTMDIASDLFGWDAGYVHLYAEADDRLIRVRTVDTVDGRRTLVRPASSALQPSPLMRLVMKEGAQLINRDHSHAPGVPLVPFGDPAHLSASMMYAPIRSSGAIIGILSLQSYTPQAYSQDDLRLLQVLADHCGDTLNRIKSREALREAEAKYRSIFENATEGIFQATPVGRYQSANPALARMLGYESPEELMSCITNIEQQVYVTPERWQELTRILDGQERVQNFESENYRKDGGKIWVTLNVHAVRDAGGAILYYEGTIQDITKRRQAEEALQRSQRLAKAIMDNIPDPVWLKDLEGRILACNEPFAKSRGRNMNEIIGKTVFDIIPEDADRRSREDQVVIQSRKPALYEARQVMEQGRVGWFETIKSPLFGEEGEVIGTTGIARDITERKWTEGLLRVQRDFGVFLGSANDLQTALEQLLTVTFQNEGIDCGAVYLTDDRTAELDLVAHQGLPLDLVRRISRLATASPGGRSFEAGNDLLPPYQTLLSSTTRLLKQEGWESVDAVLLGHGGSITGVLALGARSGREIPARSLLAAQTIAGQAGDAIARIRAEHSLFTSREMLQKTLHSLHVAVFVLEGGTGLIQECNLAATRIFGYTRQELVGRTLESLHPEPALSDQYRERLAAARKGELSEFDSNMQRKDGTVFPCAHGLAAIRDEAGRVVNWVGVVRDITRRKQTEEELRELSRRIIEVQEAEHQRVARELHDGVNQIIASAKMRLRKVRETVAALSPAAGEILVRCDHLLVEALEENRRIAHNLHPSVLDELGLAVACRNLCKELESRARVAIRCSLAEIPQRLPQAVELNLFRIAQEALNNVEKHARANRVWLRMSLQGDSIILRIRDDGRGFDCSGAKDGSAKAPGIGLKNILERVASIGGTCEVESAPNRGTTITVRAPLVNTK